jgi:hypothetical protein
LDPKQPIIIGELVIYGGRILRRIRGAENVPGAAPAGGGDPAQPDEGQGEGLGLYDLSAAPDELRPFIQDELKKVEANVTRKFQENAEYRKKMERYESLDGIEGLTEMEPEELTRLLDFHSQVLSDPQAFEEWYRAVGEQFGLSPQGNPDDEFDGEGQDGDLDPQLDAAIARVLEKVDERLAPFEQQMTQQQQEQAITDAQEEIRSELDSLKEKHGEFNEDLVCQLALAYEGSPDAIQKGFADYQRFTGDVESSAFEQKEDVPAPANSGGTPPAGVEPITDFSEAKRRAAERFAATRS